MIESTNRIQAAFQFIYFVIMVNFLWLISLVIGLGFFSWLPATKTAFQLFAKMKVERDRDRLKMWRDWWASFWPQLKLDWAKSALSALVPVVLVLNYVFFSSGTNLISYIMFYLTILMFWIYELLLSSWAFVQANYPELTVKGSIRNAAAIVMAYLPEMIVMTVILVAFILAFDGISKGLLLFTGVGLMLFIVDWTFSSVLSGRTLKGLFTNWRGPL